MHLKSKFLLIDSNEINNFPKLNEQEIKSHITLGNYQLKQAKSYLPEHLNKGKYEIRINKDSLEFGDAKIVFSIIRSRHSSAEKYRTYCLIKISRQSIQLIGGIARAKQESVQLGVVLMLPQLYTIYLMPNIYQTFLILRDNCFQFFLIMIIKKTMLMNKTKKAQKKH